MWNTRNNDVIDVAALLANPDPRSHETIFVHRARLIRRVEKLKAKREKNMSKHRALKDTKKFIEISRSNKGMPKARLVYPLTQRINATLTNTIDNLERQIKHLDAVLKFKPREKKEKPRQFFVPTIEEFFEEEDDE